MTFDLVMIDPPWKFRNVKTGGSMKSGASQKYRTMELAAIQQLAIPSVCSPNAVVAVWVPTRLKFSHGATTIAAWGLHYETTIYWDKQHNGMGFWLRNSVEELLVCTRGDVEPFGHQELNIIHHPRLKEHSAKPAAFRQLLERATRKFGRRRCLEIFAREQVAGWTCIGDMVTGRHVREDLRLLAAA